MSQVSALKTQVLRQRHGFQHHFISPLSAFCTDCLHKQKIHKYLLFLMARIVFSLLPIDFISYPYNKSTGTFFLRGVNYSNRNLVSVCFSPFIISSFFLPLFFFFLSLSSIGTPFLDIEVYFQTI